MDSITKPNTWITCTVDANNDISYSLHAQAQGMPYLRLHYMSLSSGIVLNIDHRPLHAHHSHVAMPDVIDSI